MIVVNLAHPLTDDQQVQTEALAGEPITRLIERMPHFDDQTDLAPQITDLVDGLGLTSAEWETSVVNVPGFALAAACLLAELHGRMGHFPAILRLRAQRDSVVQRYEVVEIINLNRIREHARQKREGNKA